MSDTFLQSAANKGGISLLDKTGIGPSLTPKLRGANREIKQQTEKERSEKSDSAL